MGRVNLVFTLCAGMLLLPPHSSASPDNLLQNLSDLVEKAQMTETTPYGGIGKPQQLEGIYHNEIRINFHGKCEKSVLRHYVRIPTTISFISSFVGVILLDAFRLGHGPKPSEKSIGRIVKHFEDFHDKNAKYKTSVMTFFAQVFDEDIQSWYQQPAGLTQAYSVLKALHVPSDFMTKKLMGDKLPPHLAELYAPDAAVERDYIPRDFDSSSMNIGFGSLLSETRDSFPDAREQWMQDNTNLTSVFDAVKFYAYRPFSENLDDSTIDPRTYFSIRGFLDKAKEEGRELALVTTWAQKVSDLRTEYDKKIISPWGVNNVDMTVQSNFMACVVSSLNAGIIQPDEFLNDPDLLLVLESTTDLIVYMVKNNFAERDDLLLLYYPSTVEVIWFISRGLMYMENGKQNGKLPLPVLEKYYNNLSQAMREDMTSRLIQQASRGEDGNVFYDDFLGNADISYYDEPIERHEDRIFTTTMAANSLLYTWTVYDKVNGLRWLDDTPMDVKDTVNGCAKWLKTNTLSGEFSPDSIFFSRSTQSFESLPLWYPANRFEHINGTKIDTFDVLPEVLTTIGMQGYVEPDVYEKMLAVDQFGVPTPMEKKNHNDRQGALLFWSSDALTYASVMLTVSMTQQLEGGNGGGV